MYTLRHLTSLYIFIFISLGLQAQTRVWENNYGERSVNEQGYDIAHDNCGNVYAIGYYHYPTDFGGIQAESLGFRNLALLKMTPEGVTESIKLAGGSAGGANTRAVGYALEVDDDCNVYVAGHWNNGVIEFDSLSLSGSDGIFIAKINSEGTVEWINSNDADIYPIGGKIGMTIGSDNAIYIASSFSGSLTLDSTTTLNADGSHDMFVAKYENSGDFAWGKAFGGSDLEYAQSIDADNNGNIYLTGTIKGDGSIGSFSYGISSLSEAFIAKLDADGDVIWAEQSSLDNSGAHDIAVDTQGNAYIAGFTNEEFVFLGKYDTNGTLVWSDISTTTANFGSFASTVVLDKLGNPYIAGTFYTDLTVGEVELDGGSFNDIFIAGYYANGTVNWVEHLQRSYTDIAYKMDISDSENALYLTGTGSEEFSTGSNNFLIVKYEIPEPTQSPELDPLQLQPMSQSPVKLYPNPFKEQVTVELPGINAVEWQLLILDTSGRKVTEIKRRKGQSFQIAGEELSGKGTYFYQLYDGASLMHSGKFIYR